MSKEKPAELRLLKKLDELKAISIEGRHKKHPSALSFLQAVMIFVGGLGRVLEFIEKVMAWWNSPS